MDGDERAVVEDLGAGVGGASEDFFTFCVGLEGVVQIGHVGDLSLELRKGAPDLWLGFVDGVDGEGKAVVVIAHVDSDGGANLLEIAEARCLLSGAFGAGEDREEQSGEDRDDCDDHEELNEGESAPW